MSEIYVNEDELQALATTLGARADELEALIDGVPQAASLLAHGWEGEAASAALDRAVGHEKKLRDVAKSLADNKKALESELDHYREAHATVNAMWAS